VKARAIAVAVLPVLAVLALTACEKADNEPGPGGVTMGEARALDEAAKMIEARRPPPGLVVPLPNPSATGAVAEAGATGPGQTDAAQ
jgi:hypothetical protein